MGKINVLGFEIANLIAAGEVVERPSSVLKELIENAIDSGADKIVAEIKRGGVALIRVSDNGCGIEKEDLPTALLRHATSKIRTKEDLESIGTLGFRGEALAAIASVSEMTVISKPKTAESGAMLTAEGGKVVDISDVGAADGTTVVVENLFFNVPARRKFLKKDATEAMNVAALVERVALSRPDLSIQLLIDGEERFKTPGDGDLLHTVRAVYGKEFAEKMIPCDGTAGGVRVFGLVGRSDNARKNRNYENIFINHRYVKSMTAATALERAFASYIAPECFPVAVLFVEMNPSLVDVNVHPAKLEVKFTDERSVFEAVYYTVRRAVETAVYRPEMTVGVKKSDRSALGAFVPLGTDTKGEQVRIGQVRELAQSPAASTVSPSQPAQTKPQIAPDFTPPAKNAMDSFREKMQGKATTGPSVLSVASDAKSAYRPARNEETMSVASSLDLLSRYEKAEATPLPKIQENTMQKSESAKKDEAENTIAPEFKFVGEAFDTYLFVEVGADLLVIDKHAAHERVIFEDLKKRQKNDGRVASQTLLLPIPLSLSAEEASAAANYTEDLCAVGFEFALNGESADLTAIPDAISASDAETLFLRMLDELVSGSGDPSLTEELRRERALYQIACKAAIKGGRIYDRAVHEWLIGKVLSLPDITVCPHGRPIAYKMTKRELDRQFDRIK